MSTLLSHFKPASSSIHTGKSAEAKQSKDGIVKTNVPWVEKYRPKNVDEIVYQDEVVKVLQNCVRGADLPNLLFYGPPGTGKTSAALALCNQLFKTSQLRKERVLEMNASDERGIDIVRNRIKEFARISISSAHQVGKEAIVPLKVVILDEADAMTGAAQSALRRTMESETQSTRFFLICNYITRIIEPLTSRCAKFRFKPLSMQIQRERLLNICETESVHTDEDAVNEIVDVCGGDLRKSITLLQSLAALGRNINVNDVREVSGQIPNAELNSIMEMAKLINPGKVQVGVRKIVLKGYSVNQLLLQLSEMIMEDATLSAIHKAKLFETMAEAESRLLDGADEYLQLFDVVLTAQRCFIDCEAAH